MRRLLPPSLLVLLPLLVAACGDPSEPPATEEGTVAMVLDLSAASMAGYSISRVTVDFTHLSSDGTTSVEQAVTGDTAVVEADLRPGQWRVEVSLYEGDTAIGEGETVALVEPGFVTEVDLEIEIVTGGIRVTVTWPDEVDLIADLGNRPVEVQVQGVGSTYDAHGLSRVGWDIQVLETPTGGGLTHKRPGRVRRPDVVMLDLRATGESDARALATWIADLKDERTVTMILRGTAGETAGIALHQAVPVGGDTAITDLGDNVFSVSGLRFSWRSLQMIEYTPPTSAILPPCPIPGFIVEIEGAVNLPCYTNDGIDLPQPGTSDPLPLPELRYADFMFTWAEDVRDDAEAFGCVGCNTATRRTARITFLDASANATGSTNLYGTWPASFTLFDPASDYGYDLLMSTVLVSDEVQDGS